MLSRPLGQIQLGALFHAQFESRGQQRTGVLAWRLAEAQAIRELSIALGQHVTLNYTP